MSQENESPKQWAERLAKVFGKRKPAGVRLRGTKSGTFHHEHEIRLVDNFISCRSLYTKLGVIHEPKAKEHLESQERRIYGLAHSFDIDIEPHLKEKSSSNYDFIPWPDQAESYYTEGLADKIMVTDWHELRYLLDFQYVNHVKGERFNEVRFLQSLKFLVRHFLSHTVAVVEERRLEFLDEWIYRHVSNLDYDGTKEFFWFKDAFEWKQNEVETEQREAVASASYDYDNVDKTEKPSDDGTGIDIALQSQELSSTNDEPETFQTLCSDEESLAYFDLLKQKNPKNNRPLLNDEAIVWLVGYFFGDRESHSLKMKPKFEVNMSGKEIMSFVYQYSMVVSPGGKSDESAPLRSTVRILTDGFEFKFKGKAEGYAKTISDRVKGVDTEVTRLLSAKPAKRYLAFIGRHK